MGSILILVILSLRNVSVPAGKSEIILDFPAGPELAGSISIDCPQGEHKIYCGPVQSPAIWVIFGGRL